VEIDPDLIAVVLQGSQTQKELKQPFEAWINSLSDSNKTNLTLEIIIGESAMGASHFCRCLRHSHASGNPFGSRMSAVDSRLHGNDGSASCQNDEQNDEFTNSGFTLVSLPLRSMKVISNSGGVSRFCLSQGQTHRKAGSPRH
jgi:hypothetical protein